MRQRWRVRGAAPGDEQAVAEVHVTSWRDAYGEILSPEDIASKSIDVRRAQWAMSLEDEKTEVSVAEMASRVVGFVASNPSKDDDASPGTGEVAALYLVASA